MLNKSIYLKMGECYFSEENAEIISDLGSCISICIYDRYLKCGGAIHYLLPKPAVERDKGNPLSFGQFAIPELLKKFKVKGSLLSNLEASVLGGCLKKNKKFSENESSTDSDAVSKLNRDFAIEKLKFYGIQIKVERTLSVQDSLRFKFETATGQIFIRNDMSQATAVKKIEAVSKVRVLIIDDSISMRKILKSELEKFVELEIIGVAEDAFQGESFRKKLNPDVITLDLNMPGKDGLTYLKELMISSPMPVIIVSDLSPSETAPVLKALELGAFDFIHKPSLSELSERSMALKNIIVAASKSKKKQKANKSKSIVNIIKNPNPIIKLNNSCQLIAIGASTGGTEALKEVFSHFPEKTPPILVVQHMPPVFTAAFANSLNQMCKINVTEAIHGEKIQENHAYIAPGGKQMKVKKKHDGMLYIEINDDPPVNRFQPSVDYLFESLVHLNGVHKFNIALLTGMGADGSLGLLKLKEMGAFTVVQDEETCVVFGMPKAAIELGAATKVAPLNQIAEFLFSKKSEVVNESNSKIS